MIGNVAEMGVARGQFRPRIAYPDDRTAVEKVVGKALVLHPASVDETVAIGASKPARAAELLLFFRHIVVRCLLRRICRKSLETGKAANRVPVETVLPDFTDRSNG